MRCLLQFPASSEESLRLNLFVQREDSSISVNWHGVLSKYWQREKHGGIWFYLPAVFKRLSKHLRFNLLK